MAVALPYYPRKYTCEWLETLRQDTRVWTDEALDHYEQDYFPESDGEPLAETDWHRKATNHSLDALTRHFMDRPEVYIAGDNFIYWDPNNRKLCVSPDVYVVKGAGNHSRRVFQTWEERGLAPNIVIEITSRKTQEQDFEEKFFIYEQILRVPEYFLFDPQAIYLDPPLIGYRLLKGEYQPISITFGRGYSEQLGLNLEADGNILRFVVPETGDRIPLSTELELVARANEQRADQAELEIARLRAELDTLRANKQ